MVNIKLKYNFVETTRTFYDRKAFDSQARIFISANNKCRDLYARVI